MGVKLIYHIGITQYGNMRKQLGISQIDDRNRTYIPKEVLDILPKGDYLSWELDDNECVCVFKGHLRILRNSNKCVPGNEDKSSIS